MYHTKRKVWLYFLLIIVFFVLSSCSEGKQAVQVKPVEKETEKVLYNNEKDGWLYKVINNEYFVRVNKSGETKIEELIPNDSFLDFFVTDKYVYYVYKGYLYKSNYTNKEKLFKIGYYDYIFYDGNRFYVSVDNEGIYSFNEKGERTFLCKSDYGCFAYDGWVYYVRNFKFMRIKADGSLREKIYSAVEEPYTNYQIYNGDLYFSHEADKNEIYIYKNNTLIKKIKSWRLDGMAVHKENCYLLKYPNTVIRYNMESGQVTKFRARTDGFIIEDEVIYNVSKNKVSLLDLDGNVTREFSLPYPLEAEILEPFGDYLYYGDSRIKKSDMSVEYFDGNGWTNDLERLNYDKYVYQTIQFNINGKKKKLFVDDYKLDDVNGDGEKDGLFAVYGGVIVRDGRTSKNEWFDIKFPKVFWKAANFYPSLFGGKIDSRDFDGDGVKDVFVTFRLGDPGSSVGMEPMLFSVFNFKEKKWLTNEPRYIMCENKGQDYLCKLKDMNKDGVFEVVSYKNEEREYLYKKNDEPNFYFKYDKEKGDFIKLYKE